MLSQSAGGEAANAVEDIIGAFGPYKGLGLRVVNGDELCDGSFLVLHQFASGRREGKTISAAIHRSITGFKFEDLLRAGLSPVRGARAVRCRRRRSPRMEFTRSGRHDPDAKVQTGLLCAFSGYPSP